MLASDEFAWADVLLRRRKTAAVRSTVWWINRKVRFTAVDALVPEKAAIDVLKRADIIVGCVNNLNARADLQERGPMWESRPLDSAMMESTMASALSFSPRVSICSTRAN
ncbi:MAG: hypothetical protein LAN62_07845 [Acidobacteriia bacterium]|nr:hypothetical protein [Terriglobia bacterium]